MRIARVISEADYDETLVEIRRLVECEPGCGTADGDRLDALALLAETYEVERYRRGSDDAENR